MCILAENGVILSCTIHSSFYSIQGIEMHERYNKFKYTAGIKQTVKHALRKTIYELNEYKEAETIAHERYSSRL